MLNHLGFLKTVVLNLCYRHTETCTNQRVKSFGNYIAVIRDVKDYSIFDTIYGNTYFAFDIIKVLQIVFMVLLLSLSTAL